MNSLLVGREFQFWEYKVSHGSLLIRSPKNDEHGTNVDIVFVGVEYVFLPRYLSNLKIETGQEEGEKFVKKFFESEIEGGKIFILSTNNTKFFVIAAGVEVSENSKGIFESPFKFK